MNLGACWECSDQGTLVFRIWLARVVQRPPVGFSLFVIAIWILNVRSQKVLGFKLFIWSVS